MPALVREELLFPPLMTNRLPWSRGYFEHVESRPLSPLDVLTPHCFNDDVHGRYVDEYGAPLLHAVAPIGQWGLHSYRTIDDEVSMALGIPLAAD